MGQLKWRLHVALKEHVAREILSRSGLAQQDGPILVWNQRLLERIEIARDGHGGEHYYCQFRDNRNLDALLSAFLARDPQVRKLGFDTRFMRIWDFYLAYCEAAFTTGDIELMQFTLQK